MATATWGSTAWSCAVARSRSAMRCEKPEPAPSAIKAIRLLPGKCPELRLDVAAVLAQGGIRGLFTRADKRHGDPFALERELQAFRAQAFKEADRALQRLFEIT